MFMPLRLLLTVFALMLSINPLEAAWPPQDPRQQAPNHRNQTPRHNHPLGYYNNERPQDRYSAAEEADQYDKDDLYTDHFEYDGDYILPYSRGNHCKCRCFEAVYEPEVYYHYYPHYTTGQLYILSQHPRYYIKHLYGIRRR